MQFAMDELVAEFEASTGKNITYSSASSGQLYAQISKGAPFDLFLSANEAFAQKVYDNGKAIAAPIVYAEGQLILWTQKQLNLHAGINSLLDPNLKRIAIANPESAPYGKAAKEALKAAGIWTEVESKIIYGQSISQVNHYINVKAVDCGITAHSAIAHLSEIDKGEFILIDQSLYSPIRQSMVRIKSENGDHQPTANQFFEYMQSKQAKAILAGHGFKK